MAEANFEKFRSIIAEQLGVDVEKVTPEASFTEDLAAHVDYVCPAVYPSSTAWRYRTRTLRSCVRSETPGITSRARCRSPRRPTVTSRE